MQSSRPLFVLVTLILSAVVGACVPVAMSPVPIVPTPRIELPITYTIYPSLSRYEVREIAHDETLKILWYCIYK